MAVQLRDITSIDNGAKFLDVDLHVHSYGASHDVSDPSMTPHAIVDSAIRQGLSVVAITDHNNDANVGEAIEYARQFAGQLLVLAGVEVSTAHGHVLCYFAPERNADLAKFLTKLDLVGEKGLDSTHTTKSMADVMAEADKLGGIGVAAHIDRTKTGFDAFAPGFQNWKRDIVLSPGLYGLETDSADALAWYSSHDDPGSAGTERRKIYEAREGAHGLKGRYQLAHLQGSDAHSLSKFETPNPDKPWTRMKLTELTWSAFRTALVDPEARVRATVAVPRAIPRLRGIAITGGFLNGEVIHFSNNLNCFIGGRGTGKSTAIRSLAYAFGMNDEFGTFENCPTSVVVYCEDANGVPYRYERARWGEPTVQAKEDGAITQVPVDAFRIEYFGQGELAEVAKDPLNEPHLLQDFLDRHTTLSDLKNTEDSLVGELLENAGRLGPLEASNAQLKAKRESLAAIEKKLKIAEEGKLREIVVAQNRITSEKTIRATLEQIVAEYKLGLSTSKFERSFEQIARTAGDVTTDAKSKEILQGMKAEIAATNSMLQAKTAETNAELKKHAAALERHISELKVNHSAMELQLASKIAELKTKGLAGNLSELDELLRQKAALGREIASVEQRLPELTASRDQRKSLLSRLANVRSEMTDRRKGQLKAINQSLAETIGDYTVFVRYDDAGIIDEFKDFIKLKMIGSYFQDQNTVVLCEKATPSELAEWVLSRNVDNLAKRSGLTKDWASHVIEKLRTWSTLFELQTLAKQPKPIISVKTKSTPVRDIPVTQLSDGQRHTILLTMALLAESNVPLVIDQPEDDLDNSFIYTSIVSTLRAVNERRQVILVTHNANIAVLGDSELLMPMFREDDCGKILERGSIDRKGTNRSVQNILEGGSAAFERRREMYGY